jgi:shikimate dehydrogenase
MNAPKNPRRNAEASLKISARTKVCALIGNPVEHSLSPAIHNEAFRKEGLDICYTAFRVEDLEAAMRGVRALGILGLSVTIPHKVEVLRHLDEVDPIARGIGSVNTVIRKGGRLIGYNSDGRGALRALQGAGVDLQGKRITVIGSGGAARAIAFTLGKEAPLKEMVLLGIDQDECGNLCADLCRSLSLPVRWKPFSRDDLKETLAEADGLVHCTPVGMHPHEGKSLVLQEDLRPGQFVFDIVYTPLRTRLLEEAAAAGCRVIPGVEMFIHQAVFQFELWTGRPAPVESMRRVVMESLA